MSSEGSAGSNPVPLVTFFCLSRCRYIFRTRSLSTRVMFDSTINIHLNEKFDISFYVQRVCSMPRKVYSTANTKLENRNVTNLVCLHPMIRGRRRYTSSISSPFVVAVSPENVSYNRESVFYRHHKAQGPPGCDRSCLLVLHLNIPRST